MVDGMKRLMSRILYTIMGLVLYALGIVITMNANIGYSPWDVFHAGLAKQTGLSIGSASILTGFFILIVVSLLKEKLGVGTLLNIALIGAFIDLFLSVKFIPKQTGFAGGIIMLIAGLFVISVGTYFYIRAAFGAGPRDSLMVALTRITKLPIGACRGIVELAAALIGWALGGMFGVGTIISGFCVGFCVQITFSAFRFNAADVRHETFKQTFDNVFHKRPPMG